MSRSHGSKSSSDPTGLGAVALAAGVAIAACLAGCRSQPKSPATPLAQQAPAVATPTATAVSRAEAGAGEPARRDRGPVLPTSYQSPTLERLPQADDAALRLTLEGAIAFGLANNPRLREATAHVSAARATADIAFAPFLPQIGTGFRYSAFNLPVLPGGSFVPASLGSGVTSFTLAEAGIQWTLYDFGRTAGHYNAAVDRARIEELSMARRQQTVAYEVAQTYFRLLAAEAHLRVEQEALLQADSILDETQARFVGGVSSAKTCCGPRSKFARPPAVDQRPAGDPGLPLDAERGHGPLGADAIGDYRPGAGAGSSPLAGSLPGAGGR